MASRIIAPPIIWMYAEMTKVFESAFERLLAA